MYPIFDIPPPSPSLKRTQRETNFLQGILIFRTDQLPKESKATHRRGFVKGDRTMVVAGSVAFFSMKEKERKTIFLRLL
jgi:hypothetical protein